MLAINKIRSRIRLHQFETLFKALSLITAALCLSVFSSGCLVVQKSGDHTQASRAADSGNGQAYDRLAYVIVTNGPACPDGSPIKSEILMDQTTATLVRDNCHDLPPSQQIQVSYTFSSITNQVIVVNGESYAQIHWSHLWSLTQDSNHNMYLNGEGYPDRNIPQVPPYFQAISKFDSAGNLKWSKFVPRELYFDRLRGFTDGRVVANIQDFNIEMVSPNTSPSAIVMLDASGNVLWSKSWVDTSLLVEPYSATGDIAIDDANGAIYALGTYTPPGASKIEFLTKLNISGDVLWQKALPGSYGASAMSLTPLGGVILSGRSGAGGLLMQLNKDGETISSWQLSLATTASARYASIGSVNKTSLGNWIVTGTDDMDYYGNYSQYIAMLSPTGSVLWSQRVDTGSQRINPIYASVAPDDSIYVVEQFATADATGSTKVGKIVHLSPTGAPLAEVVFQGPLSPSSIEPMMLFGMNQSLWTIASTSYQAGNYRYAQMGLMKVDISAPVPACWMCTATMAPSVANVPLTVNAGLPANPIQVPFDGPTVAPKLVPSNIPIPVYK